MADNIVSIARALSEEPKEPVAPEQKEPTIAALIELVERVDEGLQLATRVIAELDVRVRKLEIAERKRERKISIIKPNEIG